MGAPELEWERLRRQAPLLEGASAEGGGPQQAPPQPAPPQQPLERQARQEASVCQLDEPQLRELLQLELAQRARLQEPDGVAEQRLLSQEAAQQARAEELALELERRSAKDAAQHARTEELERALEQALRREEAQQARAARLEDRLHESSGPRLLRCEEQLAELAQELVDTRGMHHWQRARHREHVADLERDLAEGEKWHAEPLSELRAEVSHRRWSSESGWLAWPAGAASRAPVKDERLAYYRIRRGLRVISRILREEGAARGFGGQWLG
ncbi:unnamed protein product [Prorocentrum cordatum]|uniref:Uncharacterized protein n=1 Tax=Prorocentrum cordatum TaxID=2364126 RepID=A0ABN9YEK6_9DINO|nr:unnamed protein product [Polarella glacialis]